ncbi:hypothetical protein O6H91_03G001400 [Diphasiastrum complanatum]|uniref:Uncharacterized protein n=2 Tax=Diphasiastrum complanatum TaxID=34168 RepID=A0ACC2E2U7_DIPCM|nr:hypothetical protein O6H91_03G000900 [Diphasiastrum complanatum]KAJ7560829.1 hypothetical protein O6H91_03G001400 [Diphasiastrum complanatum]
MAPAEMLLANMATCVGLLAGAWVVKSLEEGEAKMVMMRKGYPQCPTCKGTKKVPCLCTRWSDKDFGCRTCDGKGSMVCNSCGGSGTGRRISASVHASNHH